MNTQKDYVVWLTSVFEDISSNTMINTLCEEVTGKVPSSFTCLSDCGLFVEGLNNINSMATKINANYVSFCSAIRTHCESLVNTEKSNTDLVEEIEALKVELYGVQTGQTTQLNSGQQEGTEIETSTMDFVPETTSSDVQGKTVTIPSGVEEAIKTTYGDEFFDNAEITYDSISGQYLATVEENGVEVTKYYEPDGIEIIYE